MNSTATHGDAGFPSARLGVSHLDHVIHEYLDSSIAPSTASTYHAAANHYLRFCSDLSVPPFPFCQIVVLCFVADLAQPGVVHSSIHSYLSSFCFIQITHGLPNPCIMSNPLLQYVLCGVRQCPLSTTMHARDTRNSLTIARYLVSMAQRELARCIDAMGSLLPRLFWFFMVWRVHLSYTAGFQATHARCLRCVCGLS